VTSYMPGQGGSSLSHLGIFKLCDRVQSARSGKDATPGRRIYICVCVCVYIYIYIYIWATYVGFCRCLCLDRYLVAIFFQMVRRWLEADTLSRCLATDQRTAFVAVAAADN